MRLLDFAENLAEAFDIKALGDDYLKQAAAVDPNAQYKPRMLVTPEAAQAELDRRAGKQPAATKEVPGTLKAGDGSTVVSGDGTPVQAGTQKVPVEPVPTPAPAPAPEVTPVPDQTPVAATPIPANDPNADNSGAAPTAATNFDSMSFGNAFKTARNQGLKQFTWKGKPYTTQVAGEVPKKTAPAPQSSQKVAPVLPKELDAGILKQPVMDPNKPGFDFKKASAYANGQGSDQKAAPTTGPQGQPLVKGADGSMGYYLNPVVKKGWQTVVPAPVKEDVGFTDETLERIVSLVHYR